jgi:hypothetical protein
MGCDIHAYIEFGASPVERELGTQARIGFFAEVQMGRNYRLFAALSDTRNDGEIAAIAPPRGLPATVSSVLHDANTILLSDRDEAGCTTRARAQQWVANGSSQWVGSSRVTNPDWHSHSWVTADEFEEAMRRANEAGPSARAVLAALRALPHGLLVFWYDN